MVWIRAFAPIVFAAGAALAALPALAQSTPPPPEAKAKREKVDARAMVPGPQASDAASDARPASGLTRDQRKEATLQARQEGALQPAGDAADVREAKPVPLAPDGGTARTAVADADPASPAPPTGRVEADEPAAAKIATAAPSSPSKKSTRKKARSPSPSTPA